VVQAELEMKLKVKVLKLLVELEQLGKKKKMSNTDQSTLVPVPTIATQDSTETEFLASVRCAHQVV